MTFDLGKWPLTLLASEGSRDAPTLKKMKLTLSIRYLENINSKFMLLRKY